ncbi:UxaA family hydrolase [Pararhizobium sp. IMCC21322]|uniref:UxaA family hydrolase n=1 Tax=Pararhizobium sp. IMCC21322 TaxID=3067903 RepID=UPI00274280AC|nr:UxaA family hydrolase [Pararhizobium sp. IMCC21322]
MSTTSSDVLGRGWLRSDGRFGVRNHVIALSTVALTDRVTALAAAQADGVLPITPGFLRGLRGADADLQTAMIKAIVVHPNVGAALVVTHDRASALALEQSFASAGKPVVVVALMGCKGIQTALNELTAKLQDLQELASQAPQEQMTFSDLTIALECGGSDATSALCANPTIGRFVDRLIAAGGTAIVSETAEFLGGEDVVRSQSNSPKIAEAILACMANEEAMMKEDGSDYRGVNPTQENIEAGLSTLTEKTMGALCKIGSSRFAGALTFGQRPPGNGLFFMDTPFFSPTSMTGMVLGGAQITLFAMGVFNPSGVPLAPTIKICGNPNTLSDWADGIDVDVSGIISGAHTYDDGANSIENFIETTIGGAMTCAEKWQEGQLIVPTSRSAL